MQVVITIELSESSELSNERLRIIWCKNCLMIDGSFDQNHSRTPRFASSVSPYAGGGAVTYSGWQERLSPRTELCCIQLPGRETRIAEPPSDDMSQLAAVLAEKVSAFDDLPFAFFGHSMGAILSFCVSRRLRSLGKSEPVHLFVSARRAPQISLSDPPFHDLPRDELIEELATASRNAGRSAG